MHLPPVVEPIGRHHSHALGTNMGTTTFFEVNCSRPVAALAGRLKVSSLQNNPFLGRYSTVDLRYARTIVCPGLCTCTCDRVHPGEKYHGPGAVADSHCTVAAMTMHAGLSGFIWRRLDWQRVDLSGIPLHGITLTVSKPCIEG